MSVFVFVFISKDVSKSKFDFKVFKSVEKVYRSVWRVYKSYNI